MNDRMREVWAKLEAFEIDEVREGDDAGPVRPEFGFVERLAEENGWDRTYAARVVSEYKRFVYMACFAGHPVTPSDEVDQAWHLHLAYTRSYWDRMCKQVIGRPLHHDPTRGGEDEGAKFTDWYTRTLESYRRLFGAEPPADIWPEAAVRFDRSRRWRRVDVSRYGSARASGGRSRRTASMLGLLGFGVLGGCTPMLAQSEPGPMIVIGIVVLVLLFAMLGKVLSKGGRCGSRNRGDGSSVGCTMGTDFGGGFGHGAGHHGGHDHSSGHDGGHGHSGCGGDSGGGDSGCGGGGCGGGCGGGGD